MPAAHQQFRKPEIVIAVLQMISCTIYFVNNRTTGFEQDLSPVSASPAKG